MTTTVLDAPSFVKVRRGGLYWAVPVKMPVACSGVGERAPTAHGSRVAGTAGTANGNPQL